MENFCSKSFPDTGVFLPDFYLAADSSLLPLYAYMQPVYGGSGSQTRYLQRRLVRHQTHTAMSSLGRKRIRSGALTGNLKFEI